MTPKNIWNRVKRIFRKIRRKGGGEKRFTWPTREEIALLPPFGALGLENIVEVCTPAGAQRAYQELAKESVVGFDTESKPTFIKGHVSTGPHVVQFATLKRAYIFMIHDRESGRAAASLIALKTMQKVGFGLGDDLRRIRAKLHVKPRSVLDLETLFVKGGYGRGVGVKVGVAIAFNRRFHKSKKASTSNWGRHRLSQGQLIYAANDAYAAIRIAEDGNFL